MAAHNLYGDWHMLQFFRKFFSSRFGIFVTLGFVGLIALAFAAGDISSGGTLGGVTGGDRVATVGRSRITSADLERAAGNAVDQLREENPKLTTAAFVAQGGLQQLLENLIDLAAVRVFGERHGVFVGERLVDSELAKIPAAQGVDGKFSDTAYRAFLAQRRITDEQLRGQLTEALIARELLSPAQVGIVTPNEVLTRYAAILAERRIGTVAMLPSAAFAPKTPPTDAEIAAWYGEHKAGYMLPERRTIRFATFTDTVLRNVPAPTEAEIAARYAAGKDLYAAVETRKITQLVLPTQAAAQAIMNEVAAGKSLEVAASGKGLVAGSLGSLTRAGMTGQSTASAAEAAFTAAKGKVIGPLKAPLGWLLLRVDGIENKAGKSLEQARPELVAALNIEKRRTALTDFSAKIEDEFDNGAALSDVAKELGLTLTETPPLLADGSIFGQNGQKAPPQLAKVVTAAFAMEREKQPQLAEVEANKSFVIFDVGQIAAAAPPPLAEIKPIVARDVQLAKGAGIAKAAAEKVRLITQKGMDLGAAVKSLGLALPPVSKLDMPRQQVSAMGDKAPPPVVEMFAMAKGSVRLMAGPRNEGWYVLQLKDAIPGQVAVKDPRLGEFRKTVSQLFAQEYAEQLRRAMRDEVGVTRNEKALGALARQLSGTGAGN